jgi:hypothetical protein
MISSAKAWVLRCAQNDLHWLFLALCSLLLAPGSKATELTDLGQGLAYLRIHSPTDSVPAAAASGALVLDLRYATADEGSAAALKTALAGHPASAPLFILVSPATPAAIVAIIAPSAALTLGAPGSLPAPKVVVQTDAGSDRRAYDALDAGTPVDALISGKIEKQRFDEATLVQEFKNGNHDVEPPDPPDPTAPDADPTLPAVTPAAGSAGPSQAGRLTDRVLQRAVNLQQALRALRQAGS